MQIQINSPHEPIPDAFEKLIESGIQDGLSHFETRLTRVEIHFQDQNGGKGGVDKRCLIEARPSGMSPVTAEHEGERLQDAFQGALDKLQRVLEHKFGKMARGRGH